MVSICSASLTNGCSNRYECHQDWNSQFADSGAEGCRRFAQSGRGRGWAVRIDVSSGADWFSHGFLVLSGMTDFLYKATDYYAPESECSLVCGMI